MRTVVDPVETPVEGDEADQGDDKGDQSQESGQELRGQKAPTSANATLDR